MSPRLLHWWAVVVLFTLFAGEALRNTVSWYGYAAWDLLVLVVTVVVFVREVRERSVKSLRAGFRATPVALLVVYCVWSALSLLWSAYPLATLFAVVVLGATTLASATLVLATGWGGTLRALFWALFAIVVLSLAFEAVVGAIGRPILPVFPLDVEPGEQVPQAYYWSRALLFDGGRIQGILGNANLLGFVALLLLIVAAGLLAGRLVGRATGWVAIGSALLGLALTRSSTVIAAAAVTAIALLLSLLARRSRVAAIVAGGMLVAGTVIVGAVARPALLALLGKSEDLTGRSDIWAAVTGLFLERPLLGWGWTSYWQPWVPLFQDLAVRRGVVYLQAHNAYLDVAFQLGIVGLGIFLGFLGATVLFAARQGIPLTGRAGGTDGRSLRDDLPARSAGSLLPVLLLAALLTQALAESRLLVEGNWALLGVIAISFVGSAKAQAESQLTPGSQTDSRALRRRGSGTT